MEKMVEAVICVVVLFAHSMTFGADIHGPEVRYEGATNVTAAVALSNDMFVVASAENNMLRIYRLAASFTPAMSFDLSGYLDVDPELSVTITGAAKVRDRIYWITSHSRDEKGKVTPERYRFFATTITEKNGRFTIEPVGKPCKTLMHKLVNLRTVSTLGLAKATRFGEKERKRLAPTVQGLNIGALCASHNSNMLYIALRNPRPIRVITGTPHALIVPLDNAADVIENGEEPIFGEGMLWDLQGLGIAGFEYSPVHKKYFVMATPHDIQGSFTLYRWSGMKAYPPEPMALPTNNRARVFVSAIVPLETQSRILLLCQEMGDRIVPGTLDDGSHAKSFLAFWCQP